MDISYLLTLLASAVAVILGIVVHESAHALAAYALGDKTARSRGRISLNPLHHIDPFGTVLLPLLLILAGGPVFAFAKPVPIYLGNLKHPKRDEIIVSLAGPASNIVLALIGAFALSELVTYPDALIGLLGASGVQLMVSFLVTFMSVNLSLAFFNLIPLPPLDGSSVLVLLLRGQALQQYYRIQQYAMPILIVVLYLLPQLTGIDLIGAYFDVTVYPILRQLMAFAFGL